MAAPTMRPSFFVGSFPSLRKNSLLSQLKELGGTTVYAVNKQVNFVVVPEDEADRGSSAAVLAAIRYLIPIVSKAFVEACVSQKTFVDHTPYLLKKGANSSSSSGNFATVRLVDDVNEEIIPEDDSGSEGVPPLSSPPPDFESFDSFDLLSQHTLQRTKGITPEIVHAELHASVNSSAPKSRHFRVWLQRGSTTNAESPQCIYFKSLTKAEDTYSRALMDSTYEGYGYVLLDLPLYGSPKAAVKQTTSLDADLQDLVSAMFREASSQGLATLNLGRRRLTLSDVEKAETILVQISSAMKDANATQVSSLSDSYYALLPRRDGSHPSLDSIEAISKEETLLQVLRDLLTVEETLGGADDVTQRYAALGCQLKRLTPDSIAYKEVLSLMQQSNRRHYKYNIRAIYAATRHAEIASFASEITPQRLLFHGSAMSNWLGICSRGLLLPRTAEQSGIVRTDAGMLGAGLYFASDASTAVQYARVGEDNKRRVMMVANVAIGRSKDMTRIDTTLRAPPTGFDSTRGVPSSGSLISDFADEEFVVYALNRQCIRYLVDFSLAEDADLFEADDVASSSSPFVGLAPGRAAAAAAVKLFNPLIENDLRKDLKPSPLEDKIIEACFHSSKRKAKSTKEAGLLSSSGAAVPLRSIAVRGRIVDCLADVVLMQEYYNASGAPIEAKYVFPLDDGASVYGFEAFIMGKHVVGVCKEKEQARREYREAISKGHGAYLMEKEAEQEVFTVSVGNLPPGENCVIKVLYIAELPFEAGAVVFALPAAVGSSAAKSALAHQAQDVTETKDVIGGNGVPLDIEVSVESAQPLRSLRSPTHALIVKRTESRAIVRLASNAISGSSSFVLLVYAEAPNEPRLWVEEDGEHRCAMVTFFPSFSSTKKKITENIVLLDCSASMKKDGFSQVKFALPMLLEGMNADDLVNVVAFGSTFHALFPTSMKLTSSSKEELCAYFWKQDVDLGNTDLAGALAPIYAYAAASPHRLHNILLLSDGRVPQLAPLSSLLQRCSSHARLFTFSCGSDASAHTLGTLARWGGGAFAALDFTSVAAALTSKSRIEQQLARLKAPSLSEVQVKWGLHDQAAAESVPARIYSIFSGDRQIVYAFTRATSAELTAKNGKEEIKAIVSAADNARLRGRMLHRLAIRAMVAEYEGGVYHDDAALHSAKKDAQKAPLIARSLEYGIVTPWTSFVAIEERTPGEEKRVQPSLASLLEKETVDDLPYLGWPAPLRSVDRLRAALTAVETRMREEHEGDITRDILAGYEAVAEVSEWLNAISLLMAETGALIDQGETADKLGATIASLLENGSWRQPARGVYSSLVSTINEVTEQLTTSINAAAPEGQTSPTLEQLRRHATKFVELIGVISAVQSKEETNSPDKESEISEATALLRAVESKIASLERDSSARSIREEIKSALRAAKLLLRGTKVPPRVLELRAQLDQLSARVAAAAIAPSPSCLAKDGDQEINKPALLAWVAGKIPECNVRNLSWNWSSGLLLAHLCAALRPDDEELLSLPAKMNNMSREEACATAMNRVETLLGVEAPLTAADMALALNSSALATYISRIQKAATTTTTSAISLLAKTVADPKMVKEAPSTRKMVCVDDGEMNELIREQDAQLDEISQAMVDINQMTRDLQLLVAEQGELIDNIDANICTAGERVQQGHSELRMAAAYSDQGALMDDEINLRLAAREDGVQLLLKTANEAELETNAKLVDYDIQPFEPLQTEEEIRQPQVQWANDYICDRPLMEEVDGGGEGASPLAIDASDARLQSTVLNLGLEAYATSSSSAPVNPLYSTDTSKHCNPMFAGESSGGGGGGRGGSVAPSARYEQLSKREPDAAQRRLAEIKDSAKAIMVSSIDKLIERGERIELLVDKTQELGASTYQFKKKATELKRKMLFGGNALPVKLEDNKWFIVLRLHIPSLAADVAARLASELSQAKNGGVAFGCHRAFADGIDLVVVLDDIALLEEVLAMLLEGIKPLGAKSIEVLRVRKAAEYNPLFDQLHSYISASMTTQIVSLELAIQKRLRDNEIPFKPTPELFAAMGANEEDLTRLSPDILTLGEYVTFVAGVAFVVLRGCVPEDKRLNNWGEEILKARGITEMAIKIPMVKGLLAVLRNWKFHGRKSREALTHMQREIEV